MKLKISAIYRRDAASFLNALGLDTQKYANVPAVNVTSSFEDWMGSILVMAVPSGSERTDGVTASTDDLDETQSIRSPVPSF